MQKVLTHTLPDGTPAHSFRTAAQDAGIRQHQLAALVTLNHIPGTVQREPTEVKTPDSFRR